jgi:hypothetical protein
MSGVEGDYMFEIFLKKDVKNLNNLFILKLHIFLNKKYFYKIF